MNNWRKPFFNLRLYVRSSKGNSALTIRNLERFCMAHLSGHHSIEVVDLDKSPEKASDDDIIAIPTLVRISPRPIRRIIGDLSNPNRLLSSIGVLELKE